MNHATNHRLIVESAPRPGAYNMAADEVMLESALARQSATLRFYRWSEPTVSLGYFQDAASLADAPHLCRLPTVRRLSGGGAILHHHEWTYSFCLPANHVLASTPLDLYAIAHRPIIQAFTQLGLASGLRGADAESAAEPFLCFGRSDPRDIVLAGHKVVGSAQRRRRGAVLQHGSILLRRSPAAPEFPGIWDLLPEPHASDFPIDHLAIHMGDCLRLDARANQFTPDEIERIKTYEPEYIQQRRPLRQKPAGESEAPTKKH